VPSISLSLYIYILSEVICISKYYMIYRVWKENQEFTSLLISNTMFYKTQHEFSFFIILVPNRKDWERQIVFS